MSNDRVCVGAIGGAFGVQGEVRLKSFCAIPEDADHDLITTAIRTREKEIQEYVPGYRLLQEPQFDPPTEITGGMARVAIFVEVEGAGDFLPPYAGNLDIMTAAATKVGEDIAKTKLGV